ncbi:MAG: hypothetical protein AMXMBFR16_10030 [Candidatus Uhrbacteria bacterium]
MTIAMESRLEAVISDLRWISRGEVLHCNLALPIETAELTFSSLRFGPVAGDDGSALKMSIVDLKAQLVDCARREDDAENYVCAERIRGAIRLLL